MKSFTPGLAPSCRQRDVIVSAWTTGLRHKPRHNESTGHQNQLAVLMLTKISLDRPPYASLDQKESLWGPADPRQFLHDDLWKAGAREDVPRD